jgi:hypothetical protein
VIKHFSTCTDDYPEKPKGELYQAIVEINIGTMENPEQKILQCSDCGAFEIKVNQKLEECTGCIGSTEEHTCEGFAAYQAIKEHHERPTFSNLPKTVEKLGKRITKRDNKIERLERRIKVLEKKLDFHQLKLD